VAEPEQVPGIVLDRGEAAVTATRDVLEEHALDRVARAEGEDLLRRRLDHRAHPRIVRRWGAQLAATTA